MRMHNYQWNRPYFSLWLNVHHTELALGLCCGFDHGEFHLGVELGPLELLLFIHTKEEGRSRETGLGLSAHEVT